MKIHTKIMAMLAGVLLFTGAAAVTTEAAVPPAGRPVQEELRVNPEKMQAPEMQVLHGKIVEKKGNRIVVAGDGRYQQVAVLVDDATYIADGANGSLKKPGALSKGKEVTVYYSRKMTRSLPPQAHVYAIILGKNSPKTAAYMQVDQALLREAGRVMQLLSSDHDLILTVDKKACRDYAQIRKGDHVLYWSKMVTMSLPGRANADKVIVLPAK